MLIYAIRHGETDWNAEGRLQGSRDVPLNARGRQQARANGGTLAELVGEKVRDFDFVSSPLGRTRETMDLLREGMGLPRGGYRTDDRLIEVCFGDWEACTLEEIDAARPGAVAEREADKWFFLPPGENAESYEHLSLRVADWLAGVQRPTVCVCHGGVIRALFRLVARLDPLEAALAPAYQDRIIRIADGEIAWL